MAICIYMKDQLNTSENPKSEEHIFPAGIGGIQKLPLGYVDDICNNKFSQLEAEFMRDSLIAIPRQFYGPGKRGKLAKRYATKSKVTLFSNDENEEKSIELGYIRLGTPYCISQLQYKSKGIFTFRTDNRFSTGEQELECFLSNLQCFDNKFTSLKDDLVDSDTIIIGFHEKKWFVAYSEENMLKEINYIINKILSKKPFEEKNFNHVKNQVQAHNKLVISDAFFRVCAKIIFNYLAFTKGKDYVLDTKFDKIRIWILNGGEGDFARLVGKSIPERIPFPKDSHKLYITKVENYLIGHISFYGQNFDTQVILSDEFTDIYYVDGLICDWKNRKEYQLSEYINLYFLDN